jgi:hypothetical protein
MFRRTGTHVFAMLVLLFVAQLTFGTAYGVEDIEITVPAAGATRNCGGSIGVSGTATLKGAMVEIFAYELVNGQVPPGAGYLATAATISDSQNGNWAETMQPPLGGWPVGQNKVRFEAVLYGEEAAVLDSDVINININGTCMPE